MMGSLGEMDAPEGNAEITLLELRFPDETIARYPPDTLKVLVTQGRIKADWPARRLGMDKWMTVEFYLETLANLNRAKPSEFDASSPFEIEEVVASIGQRSIVGFLKKEGIASTQVVLTQKRIYGKGRTLGLNTSSKTRVVAELTKLSSIGIEHQSKWRSLFIGVILIMCQIAALVILNNMYRYFIRELGLSVFLSPFFIIGFGFVTSYFVTRRRLLVLNFSGHVYRFSMSGIPEENIEQFVEKVLKLLNHRTHPQG